MDRAPTDEHDPDQRAFPQHRHAEVRSEAAAPLCLVQAVLRVGQHVRNLHVLTDKLDAPHDALPPRRKRHRLYVVDVLRSEAVTGGAVVTAILRSQYLRHLGLAQARGRLDQRIEHGLQLDAGPADDLQHIGSRRLLFPRLVKLALESRHPLLEVGADFMITARNCATCHFDLASPHTSPKRSDGSEGKPHVAVRLAHDRRRESR